jgi:hypothetical protein
MDRAFKSRIHLSLLYPKLDKNRTLKIWGNNLEMVRKELKDQGWTIQDEAILKFAKRHYRELANSKKLIVWNGRYVHSCASSPCSFLICFDRQIRNAFQTAIATAAYEAKKRKRAPELTPAHFKKVADTAMSFDRYLTNLNQDMIDSFLAKHNRLRDDDFFEHESNESDEEKHKKRKKNKKRARHSEEDSDEKSEKSSESSSESGEESSSKSNTPPKKKRHKK